MTARITNMRGIQQLYNILPSGLVFPYAGASAPNGFLLCDGSAIDRTTYATLFAVIGTTYGTGNGSTTFNVPNFLGRTIIGAGSGSGLTARARGDKSGEETHQLTLAESPSHAHGSLYTDRLTEVSGGKPAITSFDGTYPFPFDPATNSKGGDGTHNNMQPFGVANYIIKT
jgi:microcystin-dependent protein